jgi:hypothetical protein
LRKTISGIKMIVVATVLMSAVWGLTGCSDDESLIDLSGYWTGRIKNPTAKSAWNFGLYIDQEGQDLFGIYSDYRGGITIRNSSYDGTSLSFVIDIHPEIVTFFGTVVNDTYMSGSWSYSGDDNNGTWILEAEKDNFNTDTDEEDEADGSSNPFSR